MIPLRSILKLYFLIGFIAGVQTKSTLPPSSSGIPVAAHKTVQ